MLLHCWVCEICFVRKQTTLSSLHDNVLHIMTLLGDQWPPWSSGLELVFSNPRTERLAPWTTGPPSTRVCLFVCLLLQWYIFLSLHISPSRQNTVPYKNTANKPLHYYWCHHWDYMEMLNTFLKKKRFLDLMHMQQTNPPFPEWETTCWSLCRLTMISQRPCVLHK